MKSVDKVKNVSEVADLAQEVDLKQSAQMHDRAKTLLPIESMARNALINTAGSSNIDPKIAKQYPVLDVSFLIRSLKRQGGVVVPRFALQDVNEPHLELSYQIDTSREVSAVWEDHNAYQGYGQRLYWSLRSLVQCQALTLTAVMAGLLVLGCFYLPAIVAWFGGGMPVVHMIGGIGAVLATVLGCIGVAIAVKPGTDYKIKLKTAFAGVIPDNVRQLITSNTHRFQKICLIYEVGKWQIDVERKPKVVDRDPLVVGYKQGVYYLLAKFDTTPAEEWVKAEFGS